MLNIKGLATGIGSLPYKNAEEASDIVFKYLSQIPFWPQLPKRSLREGMVAQFGENFPCLEVTDDGLLYRAQNKEGQLERFYAKIIEQDLAYFNISPNCSEGIYSFHNSLRSRNIDEVRFIKCHITGPFTFAASVKDENGAMLLHDEIFLQAFTKGLAMKALWQASLFKEFNKDIIIFIDEPYLGCFGSAYTPITRDKVVSCLRELTEGIKSKNIFIGIHCCGNTDWSIFTDVPGIDIINFDAFGFLDKFVLYAQDLKRFLQRGGAICWGIVPTQEFTGKEDPQQLILRLNNGIDSLSNKGLDSDLIRERLFVSPSCGLGSLDVERADRILRVLNHLSKQLQLQ